MRVILNPAAGNGTGRRLRTVIERELDRRRIAFDLVQTEGPWHARELAQEAVAAGIDRIVAAGGDGTVHEVVNGIVASGVDGPALGMIPIGTGNDFVKMVPGTSRREQAFAALAGDRIQLVDVGVVQWGDQSEYFINAMGCGVDVEVVRHMRRSSVLPGGMIYAAALIRALASYRALPIELLVDDMVLSERIMILAVCNGRSIGGSFRICPEATPTDGLLDVCVIREMPVLRNARMVPRVLTGTHGGQPGVTMARGSSVRIRTTDGRALSFQLDGELRHTADGAAGLRVVLARARLNVIGGLPSGNGPARGGTT